MAAKAKTATTKKTTTSKASKTTKTTKTTAKSKTPATKKTTRTKASTTTGKASAKTPAAKAKTTPRSRSKAKTQPIDSQFRNFTPYEPKKSELYMSDAQLEHFKGILQNWRHELMEEVDRTVHHMQDEAANFPDPADRATQEEEFSIELRTRDRERKLIKKIDQTIDRLDQEDYGYCDTCGIEIGLRRLEARPTATQCVDCKSLDEIKEKQIRG